MKEREFYVLTYDVIVYLSGAPVTKKIELHIIFFNVLVIVLDRALCTDCYL